MTDSSDHYIKANLAYWDQAVPTHVSSEFYDVAGWISAGSKPRPHEAALLGDLNGLELVQLQCHFGLDALAWAASGAKVVGVDFSPAAIAAARRLAIEIGLDTRARFVLSDVRQAFASLEGEQFDVVYVSLGALCWIPRIEEWAKQVSLLLREGGRLFMHEIHPLALALDATGRTFARGYFEDLEPAADDSSESYVGATPSGTTQVTYEWNHGLAEILSALIGNQMRITHFEEHTWTSFAQFEGFERKSSQYFVPPAQWPAIPLSFTLMAQKEPTN